MLRVLLSKRHSATENVPCISSHYSGLLEVGLCPTCSSPSRFGCSTVPCSMTHCIVEHLEHLPERVGPSKTGRTVRCWTFVVRNLLNLGDPKWVFHCSSFMTHASVLPLERSRIGADTCELTALATRKGRGASSRALVVHRLSLLAWLASAT